MAVTAMLRKDHDLLRRKLEFLEAALEFAPQTPFTLREITYSLARLLEEHVRREEEALAPFAGRISEAMCADVLEAHAALRMTLRGSNTLLLKGVHAPIGTVVVRLARVIETLRAQMAEEEAALFPAVEQVADAAPTAGVAPAPLIEGDMSANAIIKIFPETQPVFERCGIACGREGYDCVDELAWRHGLNSGTLIQDLRQAALAPEAMEPAAT